ncbi:DUF4407 domain-containing protein [Thiotrichales bacterium HSG1]|nr:DUF4407 domain-containing protein [Thiotrichales bacterium HSG1]
MYKVQEETIRKKNEQQRKNIEKIQQNIAKYEEDIKEFRKIQEGIRNKKDELSEKLIKEDMDGDMSAYPPRSAGKGSVYYALEEQYNENIKEFDKQIKIVEQKQNQITELENLLRKEIDNLNNLENTEIDILNNNRGEYNGFAERITAFSNLKNNDNSVWFTYLFITLLFISIETAPVFVKIISKKGPYDTLLEIENNIVVVEGKINRLNNKTTKEKNIVTPEKNFIKKVPKYKKNRWRERYEETIQLNKNIKN